MSSVQTNSNWAMVRERLAKEMCRVRDEISQYPAPIPACDAQFNHLLEVRDALSSELARVRDLMDQYTQGISAGSIEAFLNASKCLDDAAKAEIRARIENENP